MQHDVYDYTAHTVSKNTVLQKTYRLLGLSFIPAVAGAAFAAGMNFNFYAAFGFALDQPHRILGIFLRHDLSYREKPLQ